MSLELKIYGDSVLRERAVEVSDFSESLNNLVKEMLEVMYASYGIGLAAEQVGRLERVFVIDIPPESDVDKHGIRLHPDVKMPIAFINPVVISHSEETESGTEGCLSFPGMSGDIDRWCEVNVTFNDVYGVKHKLHAKGLLARAIQHELDHLNGVLFIDHMSPVKKMLLDGRLKRLARDTKRKSS